MAPDGTKVLLLIGLQTREVLLKAGREIQEAHLQSQRLRFSSHRRSHSRSTTTHPNFVAVGVSPMPMSSSTSPTHRLAALISLSASAVFVSSDGVEGVRFRFSIIRASDTRCGVSSLRRLQIKCPTNPRHLARIRQRMVTRNPIRSPDSGNTFD